MITISEKAIKQLSGFWSSCIFHPTDAVEDAWGKRILDRMAKEKAVKTVRIYAMFEDIVYIDENGKLSYDFRVSDLRLDYLTDKGFDVLIAYGMMPAALSSDSNQQSNVSKNKTRYKGKMLYTAKPKNYALWEEVCYEYTKHNVQRYGEDVVSKWHLHCYNEPDLPMFFMGDVPSEKWEIRLEEYFKLYEGFVKGVERVSDKLRIGGPALAGNICFLDGFLKKVKETGTRLDYISLHNYGDTGPDSVAERGLRVENWIEAHQKRFEIIEKNGFAEIPIVYDEWGMSSHGFFNIEECPAFIARETEIFSAYYVKLIHEIIKNGYNISLLMLCLSGQHEMVTDFSGFRNFFTLNFFAKPIYNAHVLASRLHGQLTNTICDKENLFVTSTKNDNGEYSVLVSYCAPDFGEDMAEFEEDFVFPHISSCQKIYVYCIDRKHTNPYRLYQRLNLGETLTEENISLLREEGNMKPLAQYSAKDKITLKLSANSVYLIESREN